LRSSLPLLLSFVFVFLLLSHHGAQQALDKRGVAREDAAVGEGLLEGRGRGARGSGSSARSGVVCITALVRSAAASSRFSSCGTGKARRWRHEEEGRSAAEARMERETSREGERDKQREREREREREIQVRDCFFRSREKRKNLLFPIFFVCTDA
jgi:hypothetical protein